MRTIHFAFVLCIFGPFGTSAVAGTTPAEIRKLLQVQTKEQWEESLSISHADRVEATSDGSQFAAKRLEDIGGIKAFLIMYPLPEGVVRERETRPSAEAITSAIRDVFLEPAHPDLMERDKDRQRAVTITYSDGRQVRVVFIKQHPRYALIRGSEDSLAIYALTAKRSNQTMQRTPTRRSLHIS